ncbi:hypothetical protein FDP41_005816 [Naegleria fowleri]|uniref:IF140/IFT172/WDR19 TPR domain-containing protein n=1 Tax=Naegleria fowleri TaxID=5763 RepID=A0A6A5BAL6_NAEFO|nr:uncharacterized protein FDP41_005816 [Naegleria fowleri]KAF0975063.1 hypothetical protein FDP41_005816 [Naegleria fowleri]CAG4708547.1 unnamed protein product [Naegleria fowleri]
MQLKYLDPPILPASSAKSISSSAKITAMCWSNNNRRLAVADSERSIHLFDETGEKRERFPTKAADGKKGNKLYTITGMVFSPDDVKLAIAQTDDIVYIYRLGLEWGEKKIICNKFLQKSAITCCCWPSMHPSEIVFGLRDGRVRMGNTRNNSATTLYQAESEVVALAASSDGHGLVSGHLDGSIYRFYFEDTPNGDLSSNLNGDVIDDMMMGAGFANSNIIGSQKICVHSTIPYCLAWGNNIIASGADKRVSFYSIDGSLLQNFDFSDREEKEFSAIACNPSGQCCVVGSWNKLKVFNYNIHRNMWEEGDHIEIPNLYAVTSACWKPDGSRLVIGNMTGQVDWFDACIKRYRYKGEFEFTFVSSSQVIVKRLSTNVRIVLKSLFEEEILKVNVARDQYIIARTPRTLLLGDLESCKLSEIAWNSDENNEKFYFDNPKVCMVYKAGEFSIIEYGINDIIGSFRTEHVSTFLISARIADKETPNNEIDLSGGNKKVAYLIDSHTICILDLVSSFTIAKISHDYRIDWLELNNRASKLLFRDKQRHLHVFDLKSQKTTTLLTYCSYVQWVPESDVVVAQNRSDLCVWYNIDAPDRVTIVQIKGEVVDIIRSDGCTAVLVDEGPGTVNYDLNEGLINFGNAMEDKKYEQAASILERLSLTPETEAMWKKLSEVVMEDMRYDIAERCFAALGDVAKSRFLRKINQESKRIRESEGEGIEPLDHWKIRAEMAILSKDFKAAEQIYLEQAKVDEAIKMYEQLHKFEESIFLAIEKGINNAQEKKQKYIEWLIQSKQEDKAAKIYEKEGQYIKAINLYLQGGFPASAANVVTKYNVVFDNGASEKLLDSIAEALSKNGLFEKAGEFYEKRGLYEKAIEAYRKGKSYRFAVELCRSANPELVVKLEEEWGDYLVQQKQVESAIHHYIEANNYVKAIEAAINSRQWTKAVQILEGMDVQIAKRYYGRIARHYEDIQNLQQAKKLYIKANEYREAMEMFERYNKWEEVQSIAETFMSQVEMKQFYTELASKLEKKQRFKEAEKLFIKADETDLAINMYAKNHMFDDMVRLVAKYNPIHLKQAQLKIAEQLESEGHLRQAEHYYIEASDWKNAVNMYRNNDKWNDAIRVAKAHGGLTAWKKVALEWAKQYTGGEAGVKLLCKLGLIEDAIDYAMDGEFWEMAFEMARSSSNNMTQKLPQIHMKYAISLEEAGNLKEAEAEYINANSPKEAIDMYVHHTDWENAMRVAETHDPSLINYIIEFQADLAFQNREFEKAEKLYLEARNPEKLIEKYKSIHRFQDAKRIADTHLSSDYQRKLTSDWAEYLVDYNQKDAQRGTRTLEEEDLTDNNDPAAPARMFAQNGQYAKAIDAYIGFPWKGLDPEYLEGEWVSAVKITINNLQPRVTEVVSIFTKRLIELKRYQTAAEIFCMVKQFKDAIDVYVKQKLFSEALDLAKQRAPDLLDYVKEQHKKSLKPTDGPENLIDQIEKLADAGEWDKCLELCQKHENPEILSRNTASYVNLLVNERHDFNKALSVLEKYGVPIEKQMINVYKELVTRIIWSTVHQENVNTTDIKRCRDMLRSLIEGSANANMQLAPVMSKLYQACHIYHVKDLCKKLDLQELYTKNCVSLCRYTDEIPPDSVFYEAGKACEKMKWENMMFVFYNRFLDIGDAIEEIELKEEYQNQDPPILIKGTAELENSDFQGTDVPYKVPIPVSQLIDEDLKEEITNVVLQKSMNSDFNSSLSKCPCPSCKTPIYVANLSCFKCKSQFEPCSITGYPVAPEQKVCCTNCRRPSNRSDWNLFIMKHKRCPHCDDLQLTM